MGLYFKFKVWSEYIIPIALFLLFVAVVIVCNVVERIKEWKSKRKRIKEEKRNE